MHYFKATKMDGQSFAGGQFSSVRYEVGKTTKHPGSPYGYRSDDAANYLSVATVPTDCTGFRWPARLFEVKASFPWIPDEFGLPNKRATKKIKVLKELPSHLLFGPNGEDVVMILDHSRVKSNSWYEKFPSTDSVLELRAVLELNGYAASLNAIPAALPRDWQAQAAAIAAMARPLIQSDWYLSRLADEVSAPWQLRIGA